MLPRLCRYPGLGARALLTFMLLATSTVPAQVSQSPDSPLDLRDVRRQREQVNRNAALGDEVKTQALELYDQATADILASEQSRNQVNDAARKARGIGSRISAIQAQVERELPDTTPALPENVTVERLESILAQEQAVLTSLRVALRDVEEQAADRLKQRNSIAETLGQINRMVESVNDDLRAALDSDSSPLLRDAARVRVLARKQALLSESEALRANLELLEAQATLIPWERDLAELRVIQSEERVASLSRSLHDLRMSEAEASLERVRIQVERVVSEAPQFREMADETAEFAEKLWGPEGIIASLATVDLELTETRKRITELNRISQLTVRRFEAVGHQGDITQWWPDIPRDFPRIAEIEAAVQERTNLIPNIQHQSIQFEQERARFRTFEKEQIALAREGASTEARRAIRTLLRTRQDLLDSLSDYYGRYSARLLELLSVKGDLLEEGRFLTAYSRGRALWVRSVPGSIFPNPRDFFGATLWLLSPDNWSAVTDRFQETAKEQPFSALFYLLVMVLLLVYRPRIRRRMKLLAEGLTDEGKNSFRGSFEALIHTLLLAAPVPLALYLLSRILRNESGNAFLEDAGMSLFWISSLCALLEFLRHWLGPYGFAEAHLKWPITVIRPIHNSLLWPQVLFLPALFVALHLSWAGLQLDKPAQLQVFNNSLGRMAFIVGMGGLGLALVSVFRPRNWGQAVNRRVSFYATPLLFVAFILPGLLAVLGFYVTGILLAYQVLRTAWLGLFILIVSALLVRWLGTNRTRLQSNLVSWTQMSVEEVKEGKLSASKEADLKIAEERAQQLAGFAVLLLALVGLFTIWAEAIPTLQILKRIQIWPSIEITETIEQETGTPQVSESGTSATGEEASEEKAQNVADPTQVVKATDQESEVASVLTLWNILQALLSGLITAMLVKNVPAVIEFGLLKRTTLDSGVRIALSTLVRYTIMIIGIVVTFGFLGISWSRVQWLAAALTFGLGFGLQEIVANFVSGLILLLERPVRVGDAVTIGDLQGRVTQTKIRATTITLWDRSEMIVPNKEFITRKLINWTLSDSRRRVDIPIRVAYGTKVREVKRVLLEVAKNHPDVLQDPAPQALLLLFGDDALKFELRVFVDFGQGIKVKDELQVAIDETFQEHGIKFALPQLSIQVPEPVSKESAKPEESPDPGH